MKEGSFFGRRIGFKGRKKSGNGCTDITTKDIRTVSYTHLTIVATHLMLAAYNAEIDSCWINFFNPQEMKKALDLPENEEVVMMLELGYGNQKEPLPNHHLKKELAETVKYL